MSYLTKIIVCMVICLVIAPIPIAYADQDSAVIFVYHRIGQDDYENSNTSIATFRAHIELLEQEEFNIQPVQDIIQSLKNGTSLPPKTVGLTFEGGFTATRDNALTFLMKKKIPFTLFFSTARIDRNSESYLNWDDLRRLKKSKYADFGILPAQYSHMIHNDEMTNKEQINLALSRFQEELKLRPKLFAYPFGEYSLDVQDTIKTYQFLGAFGQHSGSISSQTDRLLLPRFSMTEQYATLDRFKLVAQSRPLKISEVTPKDHFLDSLEHPPTISFQIDLADHQNIEQLSCFASEIGKLDMRQVEETRYEVQFPDALPDGRTRINCTLPSVNHTPGQEKIWHWYGMMLTKGLPQDSF